jgi:hypothetical protein
VSFGASNYVREFDFAGRLGGDGANAEYLAARSMRELEFALAEDLAKLGDLEGAKFLWHFHARGSSGSYSSSK